MIDEDLVKIKKYQTMKWVDDIRHLLLWLDKNRKIWKSSREACNGLLTKRKKKQMYNFYVGR